MKPRWIRRLLWAVGFGCLWLNVLDDPPLHTGAYLQNVTTTAATVAKITAEAVTVHLTVTDEAGEVVASLDSPLRRRHALRVTGLQPGSKYSYLIATRDYGAERGTLQTAPDRDDAPVRFAFFGDSGDQPWWVWLQRTPALHLPSRWHWFPTKSAVTQVGASVGEYGPDFALHLGDVIYPRGLQAHYSTGFFRPFEQLIRHAPLYPVVGNHDVMNAAGQQMLANFELPKNTVTGDERCFSFAFGAVRVIALDCNTHLAGDHYMPGHPSHQFLLEQLRTCTEPWIVVASHYPMRSASRQGNNGELLSLLLPELVKAQVSLYLSGHDHCYQRFGPSERLPVPLVVSGGGGKRLYDITKDPRARAGAESLEKAYHWCSAEVDGAACLVVAHGVDGRELDSFRLELPDGGQLASLRAQNPARAARIDALR